MHQHNHAIYAHRVGIPCKTFYKYTHPDEKKHLVPGDGSHGKTKLLTENEVKFTGEILARQDRANDGLSRKEANDVIMDLNNNLGRSQATKLLSRHVLPESAKAGVLKAMMQKVQATTSDCTNTTAQASSFVGIASLMKNTTFCVQVTLVYVSGAEKHLVKSWGTSLLDSMKCV
jgi:hypothetical protein